MLIVQSVEVDNASNVTDTCSIWLSNSVTLYQVYKLNVQVIQQHW